MKREDFEHSIFLVKGRAGKPDLNRVEVKADPDGQDVRRRNFFMLTLGFWLIHRGGSILACVMRYSTAC
jgi:hypothetical protein